VGGDKQAFRQIKREFDLNILKSSSTKHRGVLSQVAREQNIDNRNFPKWVKDVSMNSTPKK
jgi:hypothetical protein